MQASELTTKIKKKLESKDILICSHSVLGFPNFEGNHAAIDAFCHAGVDIMELQFPYSDPMADGPVLLEANQEAVKNGTKVTDCFRITSEVTQRHPKTIFLIMTYFNIIYNRGLDQFAREAKESGISGIIIPDLPIEESDPWTQVCQKYDLSPIFMVTPDTHEDRMKLICSRASGFIYCVARKGITGAQTKFGPNFQAYISKVKSLTDLPTGVGFGVRSREDVLQLKGQTEIAICCSKAIDLLAKEGIQAAADFLKKLS